MRESNILYAACCLLNEFQEEPYMHEYEIFIEEINPCGGEQYSKKTLIEAEAVSPEAYVKENGRFPVLESTCNESGDVVIVTGDKQGSFVRYTFTEAIKRQQKQMILKP
jgi:hypothetical protein